MRLCWVGVKRFLPSSVTSRTLSARSVPSAAYASSTSITPLAACISAVRFSTRSSIHFTGRPARRASSAQSTRYAGRRLLPKPPPMSGQESRMRDCGTPSAAARIEMVSPGR